MKTGHLIKLLRTADGLSQTALANELGIARTYLSQIENNRVEPGIGFLKAVSQKFNVPFPLLFIEYGEGDKALNEELQKLLLSVLSARAMTKMS